VKAELPGQVVLVLQGGGALGAYQAGVYEALHDAGIEPDWVIGISVGALNGALIKGNAPAQRLPRLREFWKRVENDSPLDAAWWPGQFWGAFGEKFGDKFGHGLANWSAVVRGIPAMYAPRPLAWGGVNAQVGIEEASYYVTGPLRDTLESLMDPESLKAHSPRLTVGAVNVTHGTMRYFDSRQEPLGLDHVMASSALPPAFPAIRIDGEEYWDGGVYSNTPMEIVFDDNPRRNSLIFDVNVWQPTGPQPGSIWEVMGRQKDIQYASRSDSHIKRQKQIHKLRHIIRELAKHTTEAEEKHVNLRGLGLHGCNTTMHVVRLLAPALDSEDFLKDIDFSAAGIQARWQAGLADTRRMLARAPWNEPADPMEGVIVHELSARTGG
jgi:NTE family protein